MDKTTIKRHLPKIIILGLVLIIALLLLVIGGFIFTYVRNPEILNLSQFTSKEDSEKDPKQTNAINENNEQNDNQETNEDTTGQTSNNNDDERNVENTQTFEGNYIKADYPDGWRIIEYTDGNGTDSLVSGSTYTGITGLEIKKSDNKTIFKMSGVNGIGGTDACSKYYKFADTPASYYHSVKQTSENLGVTPVIVDLSNKTYTSFNLFDKRTRRINTTLYWDTQISNTTFETACGLSSEIWSFGMLKFQSDGIETSAYRIKITSGNSKDELIKLDAILESMEPA